MKEDIMMEIEAARPSCCAPMACRYVTRIRRASLVLASSRGWLDVPPDAGIVCDRFTMRGGLVHQPWFTDDFTSRVAGMVDESIIERSVPQRPMRFEEPASEEATRVGVVKHPQFAPLARGVRDVRHGSPARPRPWYWLVA